MKPGEIIWRLGGKNNTFIHMDSQIASSRTLNFSFQHHARWRPGGIQLWDNANNNENAATAAASSAIDIDIDEPNLTATLVEQAVPPDQSLDASQGSYQVLPNGNRFCGMGSVNGVYERTASGELAYNARFGVDGKSASYRAFKYHWTGYPSQEELALFAYARTCSSPVAFHVSWNGATTVWGYNFYVSAFAEGPFEFAGQVQKDWRFENRFLGNLTGVFAYGEAISGNGSVLGLTPIARAFVPAPQFTDACNQYLCEGNVDYSTAAQDWCVGSRFMAGWR